MAMTPDIINAVRNICSEVLRTLKNGFKFSFYFVNLLQFYMKVGMFSTQSFFFLILAQPFYFHVYNIILFLGEAMLKSEMKKLHSFMRKWDFLINLKNVFSWYKFFHGFTFQKPIMFKHSSCLDDGIYREV